MAKPFTPEEIEALRKLKLAEYAAIPIIYEQEIVYVFGILMPRLIDLAEDYNRRSAPVANPSAPTHDEARLQKFVVKEMHAINALEKTVKAMKTQCTDYIKLMNIPEEEPVVVVVVKEPWYRKFFFWKRKSP